MDNNFTIEVNTKELVKAVSILNAIIDRKHINQNLSMIKICTFDTKIEVSATDGNIGACISIGCRVEGYGNVGLDGLLLERMLKGLSKDIVSISYGEKSEVLHQAHVVCGDFAANIQIADASKFVFVAKQDAQDVSFEVNYSKFMELFRYTEFASSRDESRYSLNGVFIHSNKNNLIASAATDGHRLSLYNIDSDYALEYGVTIPNKTIDILKRVDDASLHASSIEVIYNKSAVQFGIKNITIISKLIDGAFPNYQNIVPTNYNDFIIISAHTLHHALDRVSNMTDDKFRAVKISIIKQNVEISAYTQSKGSAREKIIVQSHSDAELTFGVNPRYIIDILNLIKADHDVTIRFKDAMSPVVIKLEKMTNGKFVVMPIKV